MKRTRITGIVLALIVALLGLGACADGSQEPAPDERSPTSAQPDGEDQTELELRVLSALDELDDGQYKKGVAWHLDADTKAD